MRYNKLRLCATIPVLLAIIPFDLFFRVVYKGVGWIVDSIQDIKDHLDEWAGGGL